MGGVGWRGCIEEEKQVRHRSLVSAICSQYRGSAIRGRNSRGKREVQRGKLFACESKTFPTTAAARETFEKEARGGQGATS